MASAKYDIPMDAVYSYGTAGFRGNADTLNPVLYRVGLLARLRSLSQNGKYIGVMITASHNPVCDNGVKIVDPMGDMLSVSWEKHATRLANTPLSDIPGFVASINSELPTDADPKCARIFFARDTRPSGPDMVEALLAGIADGGECEYLDGGILTTPQLHYIVRCLNTEDGSYGVPTEDGYFEKLSRAFVRLTGVSGNTVLKEPLTVDGANGVGALKMHALVKSINDAGGSLLLNICNGGDGADDVLNESCGADFVKSNQRPPKSITLTPGVSRGCSLDGDADRIVFYFLSNEGTFYLLDGDKIATLVAGFIHRLVKAASMSENISIGIVQTAYANGSATRYASKTLNMPVSCTMTGVKHLHHKALDYDVGVYFEANGHGTVLFSSKFLSLLCDRRSFSNMSPSITKALDQLTALTELINQTVGDAISDLLLVEAVLVLNKDQPMSMESWIEQYSDLPNRLMKVTVKDRSLINTTDADTRCISPAGLQESINEIVSKVPSARSFVRPSGTENVVRIYSEASSQFDADFVAVEVARAVYDIAGGTGNRPQ